MKLRYALPAILIGIWGGVSCAVSGTAADSVDVQDPYVRAVPPGQSNSASFMILSNVSRQPHELVAAESPAARVVELHEHVHKDGMMMMREVSGIDIPAGGKTMLQPGGLHVMLIGLSRELKPGDAVSIDLRFADGSHKQIRAPVRRLMMKTKPQ